MSSHCVSPRARKKRVDYSLPYNHKYIKNSHVLVQKRVYECHLFHCETI